MKGFISFVRIFYTATLMLFGFGGFLMQSASWIAIPHGHGSYHAFWENTLVFGIIFVLLLASRLLCRRSPKWLWLGLPAIVAIYGFIGWILFNVLFLIPHY